LEADESFDPPASGGRPIMESPCVATADQRRKQINLATKDGGTGRLSNLIWAFDPKAKTGVVVLSNLSDRRLGPRTISGGGRATFPELQL